MGAYRLCFLVYAIPGFPKDIVSYVFGLSPMSAWVFAALSTVGRTPGTWVLSAQGAKTASGHYLELVVLTVAVAVAALPLYFFRNRIIAWFRAAPAAEAPRGKEASP